MPNNPKKPMAIATMWTFTQAAVVTAEGTFRGWYNPTMMNPSPDTRADKPAQRMRADEDAVIFGLLSLPVDVLLIFIYLSPIYNKFWHPAFLLVWFRLRTIYK